MTSRFRTRSRPDVVEQFVLTFKGNPAGETDTIMDYHKEEMSDIVTPGFFGLIRDGVVINNPCTYLLHTLNTEGGGVYHAVNKTYPVQIYHGEGGSLTTYFLPVMGTNVWTNEVPPFPVDWMRRIAKQKCLARVDATPYEFGEDLGEIRETIQFLRNPLSSIKELSKAFKNKADDIAKRYPRGRLKDQTRKDWLWTQRKRAEALASLWNQTRFAFLPLVRSAMSALEAWNESGGSRPERRHARWIEEKEEKISQSYRYALSEDSYADVLRRGTQTLDIRPTIMYEVTNPLYDWKFRLGLRLKDLPTVAWQLVPLSFMVDRIVDISSSITGLINLADPQVKILAASVTERDSREFEVTLLSQTHPTFNVTLTGDKVSTKYYQYKRTTWQPGVIDTLPAFTPGKLIGDITSILDLAAISISLLKSIGRG